MKTARRSPDMKIPPLDAAVPARTETATFGLGWFWGPDAQFGAIHGVIRTRVGYAGGTQPHPNYRNLGDHTETIEIDFDPAVISYEKLLDIFWRSHHPGQPAWSRQYRAVVFYHGEGQKALALKTRDQVAARMQAPVATEILPAGPFTLAEEYHQKYYLRQRPDLLAEFEPIYPTPAALAGSTAAARVNGYLAGYGTPAELQAELDALGLSPTSRRKLLDWAGAAAHRSGPGCPVPQQPAL